MENTDMKFFEALTIAIVTGGGGNCKTKQTMKIVYKFGGRLPLSRFLMCSKSIKSIRGTHMQYVLIMSLVYANMNKDEGAWFGG